MSPLQRLHVLSSNLCIITIHHLHYSQSVLEHHHQFLHVHVEFIIIVMNNCMCIHAWPGTVCAVKTQYTPHVRTCTCSRICTLENYNVKEVSCAFPPLSLSLVYIFAVTVLTAVMEAIAEAIAEGIAHIIATLFVVIIGGFISAIISALTGRRVPMPQVSTVRTRNRSAPRKSSSNSVPRESMVCIPTVFKHTFTFTCYMLPYAH